MVDILSYQFFLVRDVVICETLVEDGPYGGQHQLWWCNLSLLYFLLCLTELSFFACLGPRREFSSRIWLAIILLLIFPIVQVSSIG